MVWRWIRFSLPPVAGEVGETLLAGRGLSLPDTTRFAPHPSASRRPPRVRGGTQYLRCGEYIINYPTPEPVVERSSTTGGGNDDNDVITMDQVIRRPQPRHRRWLARPSHLGLPTLSTVPRVVVPVFCRGGSCVVTFSGTAMIVTIDGPAGSGKSTAARDLAARLGYHYLDTGAMYRAVALALGRRQIDLNDLPAVEAALATVQVEALPGRVVLNGEDVSGLIRTPEVSQGASRVAVIPAVRRFLGMEQRRTATGRHIVCEGRDQGTFVFPDAGCKFFLTADPVTRAERRYHELAASGEPISLEEVLQAQVERDARDASRDLAPMRPADDAIVIDTTHLTPDGVLARLEEEVFRRCPPART